MSKDERKREVCVEERRKHVSMDEILQQFVLGGR